MISNPLTYAVCLEELGEDLVHKFQGRAPSGRTFNEIALNHQGNLVAVQSFKTEVLIVDALKCSRIFLGFLYR